MPIEETAPPEVAPIEPRLRRLSRRGFAVGGVAALAGLAGWKWLVTRREEDGLPWPLRRVLRFNGAWPKRHSGRRAGHPNSLAARRKNLASTARSASTRRSPFPIGGCASSGARVKAVRRLFRLEEIKALPHVEMTTELKCIEGWSTVVHWAGARLADLAAKTGLATRSGRQEHKQDLLRYAALETPDREYYVGLDMASAVHPQTLLCYEMNGEPLIPEHGAPLRLVIPVKYGIKNLKQIGTIRFTDVAPPTTGPSGAMTGTRDTNRERRSNNTRKSTSAHLHHITAP